MFDRRSSQKPGDEFIANFRQNFPRQGSPNPGNSNNNTSLEGIAPQSLRDRHHSLGNEEAKDLDPTPRAAHHDPWRFTPSIIDPNSLAFTSFANQPPTYYTAPPGENNALYHNQAGDLHTPDLGVNMSLDPPLSQAATVDGLSSGAMMDMSAFNHMPPQFQNYNPFGDPNQHPHHEHQQTAFAPSSFVRNDTGYETIEHDGLPLGDPGRMGSIDGGLQHPSPVMTFQPSSYDMSVAAPLPPPIEDFRFHVTLNAPTAMIRQSDEIPVTYLNKGQAYSVSIVDTAPSLPLPHGTQYRTFIRISFEDEEQRQRPGTCWQLWKEGRGTNEAHQRGGKLQAVEYVEANQPPETDDKRTRVDLDTASFDGFSVIWTPGANGSPDCNIAVRFNFLSTDFSHSKGVKGIPVRLCAKTQTVPSGSPRSRSDFSEVSYCKVKLFRDHGAERKLSNDVAHVKKTIDKLKQQITQAESGMKDFGKRKRTGSMSTKALPAQRPGKIQKHKRTWSTSSASSGGGRQPIEEDLHFKLQAIQDMFTSTRPVSILYLRGTEQDDPDLHPVALVGEPFDLTKVDARGSAVWQQRNSDHSGGTSSLISPSSSSMSLRSQAAGSASVPNGSAKWNEYHNFNSGDVHSATPHQLASPPDQVTKLAKMDDTGNLSGWIEALGADPSYKQPVVDPSTKPAACFYIQRRDASQPSKHEYHRAIYPLERTAKGLTSCIAAKWNLDASKILRTIHVTERGFDVEVDDDVIRELPEGQDLIMEIASVKNPPLLELKAEWDMTIDGDSAGITPDAHNEGFEIRLTF